MNRISIGSIIYYGRGYDGVQNFFINLDGLKIYNREEMSRLFGFSEEMLSDNSLLEYRFAPVFRVNISDKMRDFLNAFNDRTVSKKIKDLDDERLYIYFQKHIEVNPGDHERWRDHERQLLTRAAEDWCKALGLPYDQ